MSRRITCYLVIGLDGQVSVLKNMPHANPTKVVVKVELNLPTPPRIAAVLSIELPEPPEANVDHAVEEWTPAPEEPAGQTVAP